MSAATNKHSLRALWAHDDFWDIQMQHECTGIHSGTCTFSSDLTQLARADGVLFSAQLFPGLGRFEEVMRTVARLPNTSTILWNTEAIDTFRLGAQMPLLEAKLDFTASYEMISDAPLLQGFPSWVRPEDFAHHSIWQRARPGDIAWLASNCDTTTNGRTAFVAELMRFVHVDSFGKCLHTTDLPPGMAAQRSSGFKFWQDKVRLLQNYTFTLVLENSNVYDYVTEKLFQALLAGSIPVYLGAPNVQHFLPSV